MIESKPTWEEAVRIYIAVLRNPDAGFNAVKAAESQLLLLARKVDDLIAHRNATK